MGELCERKIIPPDAAHLVQAVINDKANRLSPSVAWFAAERDVKDSARLTGVQEYVALVEKMKGAGE